jgi:hypothetical protein
MDRPEQPKRTEPESIFSTPDPYGDPTPPVQPVPPPTPDAEGTLGAIDVSTWEPPAQPDAPADAPRAAGPPLPSGNGGDGLSRRTIIALASAAVLAVLVISFVAFSILGADDPPPVAADDESPTPTASASAEPTSDATPEPSVTPEPTPKPTPAGPPVELAVGDWATVTTDELNVRAAAGENQDSRYTLVRGSVLTVAEGPASAGGQNWYRIASLGGATGWVSSGWVADPYLDTILNDPVLIRCGEVANPVFEIEGGSPVAREVLRIGDFAVPSNKLGETTLATIELARGIGAEVCVTAQIGSDGLPVLSSEPDATACGHAVAEGQSFWLRPAANQNAGEASQIKDPAFVHPILLSGPADNRQSTNMRSLLTMMSHDGAAGCVYASVNADEDETTSHHGASIEQCSVVTEFNDLTIKLRHAAGGPIVWIKLPKDGSARNEVPLNKAVDVYVSTDVNPDGIWSYASSPYNYSREECA